MIINVDGDILAGFWDGDGVVQTYEGFSICLYYDEHTKTIYSQMQECQYNLSKTDYKAVKYSEGLYTEEEYKPIKEERQKWRDKYNELRSKYQMPHLTDEQIKEVVQKYYDKHTKGVVRNV